MKTTAQIAAYTLGVIMVLQSLILVMTFIATDSWDSRISLATVTTVTFVAIIVLLGAVYYVLRSLGAL